MDPKVSRFIDLYLLTMTAFDQWDDFREAHEGKDDLEEKMTMAMVAAKEALEAVTGLDINREAETRLKNLLTEGA